MYLYSTLLYNKRRFFQLKPDIPKKPEVKIEYNNRGYESYIKGGFADQIRRSIYGPRDRMQKFLSLVDLRKGPITLLTPHVNA